MRQVLLTNAGAIVARMPRPVVGDRSVLVRTRYSLISVGTEISSLRPPDDAAAGPAPSEEAREPGVARRYLGAALRDPARAARRAWTVARAAAAGRHGAAATPPGPSLPTGEGLPRTELSDQGFAVGYSLSGEVVATGREVTDLAVGDRVACAGAGQANHADYVSVPRLLACRVPSGCDIDLAAFATVGAIALQGVRRAAPQLGERVAVLGLGLIGQIIAQLLRAAGCRVVGLDTEEPRVARAQARGMLGGAVDPDAFRRLVSDVTGGRGVDRTIVAAATRSSAVVNLALEVTRAKGTVVLVGDVGLDIQRSNFYRKEIDLLMSTAYGPGRYDPTYESEARDYPFPYVRWTLNRNMQAFLELVAEGRLDLRPLVDRVVEVDRADAAYRELVAPSGPRPLGVLIEYPDDLPPGERAATRMAIRGHREAPEGLIRYALVGAGAFGTSMLVPQMGKRSDVFFLRGVVSGTVAGSNFARASQVEVLTSDLDQVLDDPGFQLVVIATRHHRHAAQVARSLKAGKHVFVEKPLALTWEELDEVVRTAESLARPPWLMVGFNRRFSPALVALRAALSGRRGPLVLHYRVNAGYLPPEHWVQGPEGGGRNLGEACHMYDVFRFLTGSPVTRLDAAAIHPGDLPHRRDDNFSATLSYADGSLATLVYTALGPKEGLGKERLEVFGEGEAWVLEDYRKLTRATDGHVLWEASEPDKGHAEQMSRLADALAQGQDPPVPFEEVVETTAVALRIQDILHGHHDPEA